MAEIIKNRYIRTVSRLSVLTLLFILLISSVLPAGAVESNSGSYFSEEYIQEIINNTPAINSSSFELAVRNENTVLAAGTVPSLAKGRESYEWFVLLQGIMTKINDEGKLEPYLWDNGGFIIGYGYTDSFIEISVHADSGYTDADLNAIAKIVNDAGKTYGIDDIPVIIESKALSQGYSDSGSQRAEPEKTIPGVGLGISALVVIGVVLSARKLKK
ncbi:hypothetical protein MmiHf6_00730 [Methanimicrococcus hongohii]|uniref:Uncharacterized protein n=1 Tax=Methanimicrococcus hongohii TaxID=3028295 RepID=A0AA96V0K9_9EURY|nr:hypothetical protein [Methanimicrococcus sp. Hf6]WNY22788.1 hypothetical protein MmiHf6_00730 [Methanimicrococcus sp. Hf6]